jgi:hypothetical protein
MRYAMEDPHPSSTIGRGYPIELDALDLEIYQFACVFAASVELTRWGCKCSSVERLRGRFERSEASRRLIGLAAALRNVMDSWPRPKRDGVNCGAGEVGVLTPDLSHPKARETLLFREACNKVIHSDRIHFDVRRSGGEAPPSLRPVVHLYGTHNKLPWKAEIHIVSFLRVAGGI